MRAAPVSQQRRARRAPPHRISRKKPVAKLKPRALSRDQPWPPRPLGQCYRCYRDRGRFKVTRKKVSGLSSGSSRTPRDNLNNPSRGLRASAAMRKTRRSTSMSRWCLRTQGPCQLAKGSEVSAKPIVHPVELTLVLQSLWLRRATARARERASGTLLSASPFRRHMPAILGFDDFSAGGQKRQQCTKAEGGTPANEGPVP